MRQEVYMQINLNVDLEKMRQKQKQKVKTGMSMQATVNGALNLPVNNPNGQMPNMNNPQGWGANAQ
jgi:hypothetical protein